MEHKFTPKIRKIIEKHFADNGEDIFDKSQLLQYINIKMKSASRGAKARGSFANLYAVYVIIEDYLKHGFDKKGDYSKYQGAEFTKLFKRQRELPFGAKLQNHALNNRMNSEFQKFFLSSEYIPILRNLETNRYWINEHLLRVKTSGEIYNIAKAIIEIIDEYAKTKKEAFEKFIQTCLDLKQIQSKNLQDVIRFIFGLLAPNIDARLFEIVSYAILKYYYHDQKIYWGFDLDKLTRDNLTLYKTGRTNANDGGIDFVMKPLGRFFQVTETVSVKKYFLDIDKIHRYPITFVVKSEDSEENLREAIKNSAIRIYSIKDVVDKYMQCIEEIINIQKLHNCFLEAVKQGYLKDILDEIVLQSKVEFNYSDNEEEEEDN